VALTGRARAWWLGLRWLALAGMVAVVYVAAEVSGFVAPGSAGMLWLLIGLLGAFDALLTVMAPERMFSPALLGAQIAVDSVFLGAAIHVAGGLSNPFAALFALHAVIAALLLPPVRARAVIAGVAGFVAALTALEAAGWLPPEPLLDGAGRPWPAEPAHIAAWGFTAAALTLGVGMVTAKLAGELRHSGREIAARTQSLQAIVDCMADAVVFAAPDGRIVLRNQAAAGLWAGPAADDLRVCHDPSRWDRLLAALADPPASELHPVLRLGERSFEATYARVCGVDGELLGAVMVARDVTERLAEQQVRVDRERMATIGRLAAALAHELNNPLAAINLFTQYTMRQVDADSVLHRNLGTVLRNSELCSKIVSDLLSYARQRPPQRTAVDPADLLGDAARTLEPQSRQADVTITVDVDAGFARRIDGDPDQLRQILVNLGLNAIDAMQRGGKLGLAAGPGPGGAVALTVSDTGSGIAPEQRERVFTDFYTTKAEGTGLGLAVVRDLVSAHGGTVDFASTPGEGTTFTVVVPAA
jgi:signal transduction histidine kinase